MMICDWCGEPVRLEDGWFRWFEHDATKRVIDCALTHNDACCDRYSARHRGTCFERDHHLDYFTGDRALPQFARLVVDYEWEPDALRKAAAFFLQASKMRTSKRARIFAELEGGA